LNNLSYIRLCMLLFLVACHQPAGDVQEAKKILTAMPKWHIKEILIDDAPVFKDGKHLAHLSGIEFKVYMDWVRFLPNGTFEGHFKDSTDTKKFQWEVYEKQNVIALRDSVTKTGGWNVYPTAVFEDKFEMITRSTAYDPPHLTKVTLRFVR
jgi:hypothetical protein